MTQGAYYNEFDPKAAAWLRELIKRGLIAPGEVDERSISDVAPSDLSGFTQCHFFAGIGGWSLALRLAGWPDDRPVWTGSCPCQPFSSAGKGAGFADERHLWPDWEWLVSQCRPAAVFGEQVASKDGLEWLDLVSADLEGQGYAVGASDMCAAGFGAPHIRQRLWWVGLADSNGAGLERYGEPGKQHDAQGRQVEVGRGAKGRKHGGLADPSDNRCKQGRECISSIERNGSVRNSAVSRMADTNGDGLARGGELTEPTRWAGASHNGGHHLGRTDAIDSPWRDADWLYCRDGKWRAVESGTFPLAHGVSDRVVRLRGYGNAIVPQVAAEWIKAVMSCEQ